MVLMVVLDGGDGPLHRKSSSVHCNVIYSSLLSHSYPVFQSLAMLP